MGIWDHLTCFLKNLYTYQEQQLQPDREQRTGSKLGKEYVKAEYCHPTYLIYMQSTSCEMPGWMKHKLESRLPREISPISDMHMTPSLWQKARRTKEPLVEGERGQWKSWLEIQHSKNKDHGIQSHLFMENRWGKNGNSDRYSFLGSKVTEDDDCSLEIKTLAPWKKSNDKPRQHIKMQRHYFADKGLASQSFGFFSSHVWTWELDHKVVWAWKNWWFWTVGSEETLESPLDSKVWQPVNPKGNQSWIFIGRTDAEVEAPIIWPPDAKNWLIRKDPNAVKNWR